MAFTIIGTICHQPEKPMSCNLRAYSAKLGIITIIDNTITLKATNMIVPKKGVVSVAVSPCFQKKTPKPATTMMRTATIR